MYDCFKFIMCFVFRLLLLLFILPDLRARLLVFVVFCWVCIYFIKVIICTNARWWNTNIQQVKQDLFIHKFIRSTACDKISYARSQENWSLSLWRFLREFFVSHVWRFQCKFFYPYFIGDGPLAESNTSFPTRLTINNRENKMTTCFVCLK